MIQTKISLWFHNLHKTNRFLITLFLTLFIAWVDFITPAEFSVRLFYLIPIFLSVWYEKDIKDGIFLSILSTLLYYYVSIRLDIRAFHGFYLFWELIILCVFYVVFVISVNKIKNDKVELRQSESKFRDLFNNSEVGMFITKLDGSGILDYNDKYLRILNYTRDEIIGKPSVNIWADKHERDKMVNMLKADGRVTDFECDMLNKQGEVRRCIASLWLSPEKGFLEGSIQDITERKQAELVIQQQNEQLKELNATKDKFFSVIAHDLRSPFMGFLGLTKTIADEANNISTQEMAQIGHAMHKAANNLFKLLQNLLEWSQMQNGSISLMQKDIELSKFITQNVEALKNRSELKGISINNLVTESIHAFADEQMLNSVLLNLLSNAVKFTPRNGTVTIDAKKIEDHIVEISVRDTGVGMNKDIREKLFKVGEKTGRQGTEGELSTGLGLLLCKEFIEKYYGRIWVESEEGVGSTFYFTLPSKE